MGTTFILMDIRMPVMDGIEATKAIRALDRIDAAAVPIIAMSANAFQEDVKIALEADVTQDLVKLPETETLYRQLASIM